MRRKRKTAAVLLTAAVVLFCLVLWVLPYPSLQSFRNRRISTCILDCNDRVVQITSVDDAAGLRREWAALSDMPPHLADIFIASEDKHFRHHLGIDLTAIARAIYLDAAHKRVVSGASTITMQLARIIRYAKRADDTRRKSLVRAYQAEDGRSYMRRNVWDKAVECMDALRLEARLSKDDILELYLNNIPFGFNTEGVASAARTFFGVPLYNLTVEQCLLLAVIPRRPAAYNPLDHPNECARAASLVIDNISDARHTTLNNWVSSITSSSLLDAALQSHSYTYPFDMPHYIRYLQGTGAAMLGGEEIGLSPVIHLSADLALQHKAEALLAAAIDRNVHSRITQGALLACDTQTGEVLAWVGSRDYADVHTGQVDGVTALEQPGSAMKPFLYALAIDKYGYAPSSVLPDVPLEAGGEKVYVPQNFNNRYSGPVRLRVALASSLNIPAVHILRNVGMERYKECLHCLHFSSLDGRNDLGLSLALGGAEVSLLEMVRAFSVFARDGIYLPLVAVKPPRNLPCADSAAIYSPDTARLICSILSDASARAMGFGYSDTFSTPFPAMFKTGTANQYTSIVAFAATARYTVGVWMGNFDGNTVRGITGSAVPARVAREMLIELQERLSPIPFALPSAWQAQRICSLSGMFATSLCPNTVEDFVPEAAPPVPCTWHTNNGVQYPPEYAAYISMRSRTAALQSGGDLCILSPQDGSVFFLDPAVPLDRQFVTMQAAGGIGQWQVLLDGSNIAISDGGESINASIPLTAGVHTCTVRRGENSASVSWSVR